MAGRTTLFQNRREERRGKKDIRHRRKEDRRERRHVRDRSKAALREMLLGESSMTSCGHQPSVIGAHRFHSAFAMRPAADGCAMAVMDRRRMPVRVELYG